jgi:hypothetical protein
MAAVADDEFDLYGGEDDGFNSSRANTVASVSDQLFCESYSHQTLY